jgi:hypothetical protein
MILGGPGEESVHYAGRADLLQGRGRLRLGPPGLKMRKDTGDAKALEREGAKEQ